MEEMNFQALLDLFASKGLERGEQVVLGNFGTVQTLLSLIFGAPCNVYDVKIEDGNGEIIRWVHLRAGGPEETVVCAAESHIPLHTNRWDIVKEISKGDLGIGQLISKFQIPNRRKLVDVARDEDNFWRTYTITGPHLDITITEYFPKNPFREAGWILQQEGYHGQ
jgi:chorismate-pyruvate lyase